MTEAVEPNTGYYAKVIADSVNSWHIPITTFEVCFPRIVLAEFNTHGRLSRNSASSRAIPVPKQLELVEKYPWVPTRFPLNGPGMQPRGWIEPGDPRYQQEVDFWIKDRDYAIASTKERLRRGLHKQFTNRLLEPFMWQTVVVTATELENFFNLRTGTQAQEEIAIVARLMKQALEKSTPVYTNLHVPYVTAEEKEQYDLATCLKISTARCGRVSFLNLDNSNPDIEKDVDRHDQFVTSGHFSPTMHPAVAATAKDPWAISWRESSNYDPSWVQYRKMIPGEAVYKGDD